MCFLVETKFKGFLWRKPSQVAFSFFKKKTASQCYHHQGLRYSLFVYALIIIVIISHERDFCENPRYVPFPTYYIRALEITSRSYKLHSIS